MAQHGEISGIESGAQMHGLWGQEDIYKIHASLGSEAEDQPKMCKLYILL